MRIASSTWHCIYSPVVLHPHCLVTLASSTETRALAQRCLWQARCALVCHIRLQHCCADAQGGIPFEDYTFPREAWPELKVLFASNSSFCDAFKSSVTCVVPLSLLPILPCSSARRYVPCCVCSTRGHSAPLVTCTYITFHLHIYTLVLHSHAVGLNALWPSPSSRGGCHELCIATQHPAFLLPLVIHPCHSPTTLPMSSLTATSDTCSQHCVGQLCWLLVAV